jgi:hypothetical protein
VEHLATSGYDRFSAALAYFALGQRRLEELREGRLLTAEMIRARISCLAASADVAGCPAEVMIAHQRPR